MSSTSPPVHPRSNPYRGFDQAFERLLGADMRLLYGMGVPVIGASVIIAVLLAFTPSPLVVGGLLVLELALLVVVLIGFVGMLNETDDGDSQP